MRISAINGLNGPLRNENVTFIGDLDQWVRLSRLGRFLKVPVLGVSWTDHELNQTKLIDGEVLSRDYRQLQTSVVEELTHWPSKEAEVLFEVTYNRLQAVILSPLGFFWLGVRHLFASLNVARRSSLPFSQTGWKLLEIAGVVTPFAAPLARGFRRLRNR